ncbi:MAG TPA: Asp-tRNA(Asn)/Glu-tRNA(Gln) amidotransferase GatCAB subunit C [Pusillimonas sp.]|jgi:aspartyl-tRNA(Asn)/glutamyl-tRNA(Gln) amidotransferase subunit C|nr:Asp-tRNA(Asn)/Glu-tRNA(Gln) amidotransferase GatCAB subunit C [Pusillimonas sp.]MBC41679.1 Asp-tRNA(Asn)/Glu-tRNA(Gln) amidotransferase GatCAB subunit C [Pusillimonas sp.]HBT33316.1 Asp-tRNA(Asn)/Glu-tRNA(Gln) amidotransferase GatCAB subunit C [Pusillimonas sp.]HCN70907.1 Asp-tRNA(Asn)/Glu-tRNA(Gln) amidotransferase GatCAB subunit C [Pusillimonas sp.]HCP79574.1 Asp-tRNA(Asn)/Glu-tRNA(Gln) amidotransferase GatCAB subunit C [Pusillimonas sp.]|tara:strand:+ start:72464 stop:72772 length:309 start_codon:yes stop_codon:yes gene_type:complete
MAITQDDVSRVARLARIALSNTEQTRMENELNGIMGLIEQLQAIDTTGIEPMAHPLSAHQDVSARLREDTAAPPQPTEQRDHLMANAPASEEGLFLVPKVIE